MNGNSELTSHGLADKHAGLSTTASQDSSKQTIAGECYSFAQEATMHGISRFGRRESGWVRRLLWLLLWLAMVAILLNTMVAGITRYLSRPYTVHVTYENIHNHSLPDVTICNNNPLLRSIIEEDPMAKLLFQDFRNKVPPDLNMPEFENWTQSTDYISLFSQAVNLDDFVSNCVNGIEDTSCPNMTPVWTVFGLCFTLSGFVNSKGNIITASLPGKISGYKFIVDVQLDQHASRNLDGDGEGIYVIVHPTGVHPDYNMGFLAAPGTEQYVGLHMAQTFRLGQPYSDECRSEHGYTQSKCMYDCMIDYGVTHCGCDFFGMVASVVNCSIAQVNHCIMAAYNAVYSTEADANCSCPLPCEEKTFPAQLSSLKYPAQANAEQLTERTGKSKDYIERNMVAINLYFQSFIAQKVREEPSYELAEFAADIGGQMGLFLGASFISITELLEFLCSLMLRRMKPHMISRVTAGR